MFYDFNKPEEIPAEIHGTFDMIVIDPPFITREVWEKVRIQFLIIVFALTVCSSYQASAHLGWHWKNPIVHN